MMGVFIRLTAAGALAAVATFASGCAADPAVDASRAADAADTSATLAMPEAGALQEAEYAEQDQRAADEAAVRRTVERYFALVLPSAQSRKALRHRQRLFATSCTPCVEGTAIAARFLSEGVTVQGKGFQVLVQSQSVRAKTATLVVRLKQYPYSIHDERGDSIARQPKEVTSNLFRLRRQPSGDWLITDWQWSPHS
jgi:hypothetical protein